MSWLIDFIFSNFWLIIILYGVFSTFSKAGKKKQETPRSKKRPVSPRPKQSPVWDEERPRRSVPQSPEPKRSQIYSAVEWKEPPVQQTRDRREEREDEANDKRGTGPRRPNPQTDLANPVQGMIWSQVYGPPRSKQPHRRFK